MWDRKSNVWEQRKQVQKRWKQGFTLPELLVVLILTALLLSFFLPCFFTLAEEHRQRMALLELEDNLLIAMEFLTADIAKSTAVLDCQEHQLVLQQEHTIYYNLGEDQQAQEHVYDLQGNILYRREKTQYNRQPMANFLKTLSLEYLDDDGKPTRDPESVQAVHVTVIGCWKDRQIQKEQIVRLIGDTYL